MAHNHEGERLTFGCPECVARAEQARIDNAPTRRCVWRCTYLYCPADSHWNDDPVSATIKLTIDVKVPDGWTWQQVDEHYASRAGESFVFNLPPCVPFDETQYAMETMEVVKVDIGDVVDAQAPTMDQPELFA